MNENKFEASFLKEYNNLNLEQKQAVDAIYGPVMVVAGPGTGKTQILALRIANLLRSDAQVSPQNILCLTFTDEGKLNMRDRLFKLVGAETAQNIQVHSFHSFCNDIILQNLPLLKKDELEQVSELEKLKYAKELLSGLKRGNKLYSPKETRYTSNYLLNLFGKMKQENWSSTYLIKHLEEYIECLKNAPESIAKTGKTKGQLKKTVKDEIESYKKLLDAVNLFDAYKTKMLDHNRYDYDDMINWVVNLLQTNTEVLWSLQERYQYLLVDEFQDTNGAQMQLITQMCNYDDSPNVFVVGDDDQSIFRFQGASVENMLQFQHKYKEHGLKEICLKINYRSPQGILNYAKNLIEHAGQRLVTSTPYLNKDLVSFKTIQSGQDFTPKLISTLNPRYERIYIAQEIQKLLNSGVKANEIAVLSTKNEYCLSLSYYLSRLKIPFYLRKEENLLQDEFATQIINILRYIDAEHSNPYSGDHLLFEILHYPFFEIDAIEIAKTSILSSQKSIENRSEKYSYRRYLNELLQSNTPTLFDTNASDTLLQTVSMLELLIKKSFSQNLFQLIQTIIKECGLLKYLLASPSKFDLLESLTAIKDLVEEENHRNTNMQLRELIDFFDIMDENKLNIPLKKLYGSEEAVRLFTIHSSKGREFEYVFLTGLNKKEWEDRSQGNKNKIKLPPTVFETALSNKDNDELRRMLYVGLTRAKKELKICFTHFDINDKEDGESLFLYEIFGSQHRTQDVILSDDTILDFETIEEETNTKTQVRALEKQYIDRQLANFELNSTALNNFLKCPLHFYYNNILRIPDGIAENMALGSAIHFALEKLFNKMLESNNEFPEEAFLLDIFSKFMHRNKEKFGLEAFPQLLEYGIETLSTLYRARVNTWYKKVEVEYRIKAIFENSIPLKGFIDKVEFINQQEISVVDYKTGNFEGTYAKSNLKAADKEKNFIGGSYWRQAIFYKLLFEYNSTKPYTVRDAKFEFVEPSKSDNSLPDPVYFYFPQEEVDIVKEQIRDTWTKIQNHEFYTGCGEKDCEWCKLSKLDSMSKI